MKRLIALLAGLAILMSMSVTSFAAYTDVIKANTDGTYTVALPSDAATENAGKQTTIVAFRGSEIVVGSIQYIDQAATDSFTFQLKDALTEDVKVAMGGELINKQEIGTIYVNEPTPTPDVTPTPTPTPDPLYALGGTIEGYYVDTAVLPTIEITDGTNTYEGTITDGVWEVEGGVKAGTYSVYASKDYHTYHRISALEVAVDTTDVPLYVRAGDLDMSEYLDIDDIGYITDNYYLFLGDDGWDDVSFADIDESEYIDIDDIGYITDYYYHFAIDE